VIAVINANAAGTLLEHCTGIAEVVGSNPAQSLKIFSGFCSSSVTAAFALITVI